MWLAAFATLLFLSLIYFLKKQYDQRRRIETQRDLQRGELLPRFYQSFVEVENMLWDATEEGERSKWNTGAIRLQHPQAQIVREFVQGIRQDFALASRIFSAVVSRSPSAEILIQLERHRLKIELPYFALCAVVRLRLLTSRVSMKQLRQLADYVSTMAYEVRYVLGVLERNGQIESVESLLRRS